MTYKRYGVYFLYEWKWLFFGKQIPDSSWIHVATLFATGEHARELTTSLIEVLESERNISDESRRVLEEIYGLLNEVAIKAEAYQELEEFKKTGKANSWSDE